MEDFDREDDRVNMDIFWDDLTDKAKQEIADILKEPVEEVAKRRNWDVFPLATVTTLPDTVKVNLGK